MVNITSSCVLYKNYNSSPEVDTLVFIVDDDDDDNDDDDDGDFVDNEDDGDGGKDDDDLKSDCVAQMMMKLVIKR